MRLLSCLWCLFFCAAALQALPKISVVPGGRGFIDSQGRPYIPFGVTYYRPGTGWAPQVWRKFDAAATRRDFARMKELGVNCVRVFLSFGSFYRDPGLLDPEGLAKFDQFLSIAEEAGIYVHPTGPDLWEGLPNWPIGKNGDEKTLAALEIFWKLFAARYCGRAVIFAYDLRNEPDVEWGNFSRRDALNNPALLAFQESREHLADEWTRRQSAAIKSVDAHALVTVGLIQWSVPSMLPADVGNYSAFRPQRQARFLDFLEIHFYPWENGGYKYDTAENESRNLAYCEGVMREVALAGKPVVLAEFGWYGGGKPKFGGGQFPAATEDQQARYNSNIVVTSAGLVCGWLNWGFYDQPEAQDCSELTGLVTAEGQVKAWGRAFQELSSRYTGKTMPAKILRQRPTLDWDACRTSVAAGNEFREKYFRAFTGQN